MNPRLALASLIAATALASTSARADNPLFLDQFSADPTARNFNGKIYLFNSHDILPPPGQRGNGFYMADYHVHSSENLMDWTDHGIIVDQKDVPWANPNYSMWAPDCVFKNGKYYFYFPVYSKPVTTTAPATTPANTPATTTTTAPATTRAGRGGRGAAGGGANPGVRRVGVAVADKPEGPYKIEPNYIPNIPPAIDPSVLIDPKDNQAYLIYAMNDFFIAKLKDNMLEMAEEPKLMTKFPNSRTEGLIEGPFAFERKGKYYVAYPHAKGTELLEYAMADNSVGPYTYQGIIMDQSKPPTILTKAMRDANTRPQAAWTNQCSLVEYNGQWLIFYHDKDLSPEDGNRRSVHADYITFNDDGTINKVTPTLRGVGTCDAKRHIQIDRYSAVSKTGTAEAFLDESNRALGWEITLSDKDAFVQYDRVDFGTSPLKSIKLRAASATGGPLEIHLDKPDGPIIAKVIIPKNTQWAEIPAPLTTPPTGLHNLVITMPEKNTIDLDWVTFE